MGLPGVKSPYLWGKLNKRNPSKTAPQTSCRKTDLLTTFSELSHSNPGRKVVQDSLMFPIGSMGLVYLPTFPLECGHFSHNVGKYTIHGSCGFVLYLKIQPFLHQLPKKYC